MQTHPQTILKYLKLFFKNKYQPNLNPLYPKF